MPNGQEVEYPSNATPWAAHTSPRAMLNTCVIGDCCTVLRDLIAQGVRVNCVVTSPPYWGLRDYGTATWEGGSEECQHSIGNQVQDTKAPSVIMSGTRPGCDASRCLKCGARRIDAQIGLEPTLDAYVQTLVEVFHLVREVLAEDGVLFLNLGDSYAGSWSGNSMRPNGGIQREGGPGFQPLEDGRYCARNGAVPFGLKPKDLCGVPWRLAFALQADGWYLRQDIIWAKPNPMPESVTDRMTKAHEYIFLLAKRANYYFDQEAIREPHLTDYERIDAWSNRPGYSGNPNVMGEKGHALPGNPNGRNRRSVWTIPSQPFPDAHFATFPEALVEPCILAGTSEKGHCPKCGKGWKRVVERESIATHGLRQPKESRDITGFDAGQNWNAHRTYAGTTETTTLGWSPACDCGLDPVPGIVLDPFLGSGTVARVAQNLGRNWLGIELNENYAAMVDDRTRQAALALAPA